jgi:PhnB protein
MTVHELFPYMRVKDAPAAIRFYTETFGAKEKFRLVEPSGRVGHAELDLGGATLMLCDEFPEFGLFAPRDTERAPLSIHLHVDDADAVIARAIAAGATMVREPSDAFYGERSGVIRCPFGHEWMIGHEIEAVEPAEMQRRYTEMLKGG